MAGTSSKTKVACKACHLRRVRCDRTDHTPCSRCRTARQDCEPIVSKRGKHKRGRIERFGFRYAFQQSPQQEGSSTATESGGSSSQIQSGSHIPTTGRPGKSSGGGFNPSPGSGSEPRSGITHPQNSSHTTYYGDEFNLEYARNQLDSSHEEYGLWAISQHSWQVDRLGPETRRLLDDYSVKERARLNELGAFDIPDPRISESLIKTFFDLIYPVAPIIDRRDFCLKLKSGRVSPLLLQAVYLVGYLLCEPSVLTDAGYSNRYMATFTYYQRAKALYDAGYEPDAVAVLQAVFCLSFWWDSPTEQKDMWHWAGIAAHLAQSLGLHQERTYSRVDESKRKLWRRIWWVIYSHDISTAVVLGRSPHINEAYCTTEPLTEQDFDEDDLPEGFNLGGEVTREMRSHLIYLADLCKRVGKCHLSIYKALPNPATAFGELDTLASWKAALPDELQCRRPTFTLQSGFLASVLNLCCCTFEILLRRNFSDGPEIMAAGTPVFEAAVEIVRILENLLSSELLTACPLRILPGTFAALSVLITNMRKRTPDIIEVSKHRARLCMLVAGKLRDYWPPLALYYPMFARILASQGCPISDEEGAPHCQKEWPRHASDLEGGLGNPNAPADDLISGDTELFGMASLFPLSAFLNEEFMGGDIDISLPLGEPAPNPHP
ncbi:Zn(II)2Cys6 transcription factor [Aspergillus lucknowensis]|uniref:Fungal-specific transcription factor domain-containing protein n=1 Tax=Aspergillus lucknowensis TaxID=176173 RepID=A0ABR4M051_9EURO